MIAWRDPFPLTSADHRARAEARELKTEQLRLAAPLAHALVLKAWHRYLDLYVEEEARPRRLWLHELILELSVMADLGHEVAHDDAAQMFLAIEEA